MSDTPKPDRKFVPYKRVWLYFLLTIPLLILMGFAGYVLWIEGFWWLTLIYIGCFVFTSFFQSFYCVHIDCPYIGGFCPAVAGIMPAAWFAKLWQKLNIKKSKRWAHTSATIAFINLLGLIGLPLYWLFTYHIAAFIGYLLGIMLYAFAFLLTICPVCASQESCPGGQASIKLRRVEVEQKDEKELIE